jgi:hypothetical protein
MPAEAQREAGVEQQPICNPVLEGDGWSTPCSARFTLRKDAVIFVQELVEPRDRSGGTKNIAPTGIRSPDRPARGVSLYRLRYVRQCTPTQLQNCQLKE